MKGKIIVLVVILADLALLSGNAAIAQPTSLTVHVQDESGFPPPSEDGARDIPYVPVALYTPGGDLVTEGTTNASGIVVFEVSPGDYTLQYGGSIVPPSSAIGTPIRAQPITVNEGENTIAVNAPWIAWHDYETGLPMEFNYMDLDPLIDGPQREVIVEPGATVTATVSWWELSVINIPRWYVSLFGDWQPTEPLVNVKSGNAGPSSHTLHTETVTFQAPTSPGVYKIRLVDVLDFAWPPSFYTAYHYHWFKWYGRDMGVSIIGKSNYVDYGEGTITVQKRVYLPLVTRNFSKVITEIEVLTPVGFQPLGFSIVHTLTPIVGITLRTSLSINSVEVLLDDSDPSTPAEDITDLFIDGLLSPAGTAMATVPVAIDHNTIHVTTTSNGAVSSESASMLNFDNTIIAVSPREILPLVWDGNALVEKDTVIVIFQHGIEYPEMSQVLHDERLVPVGFNFVTDSVRARITDGRSPAVVAARLSSKASVQAATPNFAAQLPVVVGENMPRDLRDSYRARAGARCTVLDGDLRGCFDYDGPDPTNELRIFRQHFFMDTFAGHRLVDHLVGPNPAVRVAIADVDSGVGNGANTTDIPIDATGLYGFSRAPFTWDNTGNQIGAGVIGIAAISDTVAAGHGTQVIAAAAGRGTQVLGTGKDLRVRPIRYTLAEGGTAADARDGIMGACRDTNVAVVIMEIWNAIDTNRDGVKSPAERAAHAAAALGIAATLQPAIDFCRNPFVDTGRDGNITTLDADGSQGDSIYQVGEPFSDTDGDGNFNPDRDGKILAAPLGNDGENLGVLEIPSRFVPARPRPPGAPFVFGVSAAETVGAADGVNNVRGPEGLADYSNFGPRVSVSALGTQVILPDPDGNLGPEDGTSFATPIAAGLVGEMIFLDRNLARASLLTPLQIIEILEATADDLDSSVAANDTAKPNDRPGNGRDDAFGYGRINVWKALLAVANGGIATDRSATFPSLLGRVIEDSKTAWYGFKIHSPMHEATVWLDGEQLADAGLLGPDNLPGTADDLAPNAPNITAHAGVRSDHVILIGIDDDNDRTLDEDPTSGIVPLGNERGEYLITFSIEGHQLRAAEKLELRTGNDADEKPFFTLDVRDVEKMREGKVPGVVFDDFVFYVTPTDFGDADPTKSYSVLLHEDGALWDVGAHHLNTTLEWFGKPDRSNQKSVSGEVDANDEKDTDTIPNVKDEDGEDNDMWDMDARDDGVVFYTETFTPTGTGRVDFTLCVADEDSGRYGAVGARSLADGSLYVNAWIDWNADGDWSDDKEYILDGAQIDPSNSFTITVRPGGPDNIEKIGDVTDHCQKFEVEFPLPDAISRDGLWARFRVDYGEDVGHNDPEGYDSLFPLKDEAGPARHGEVEDYFLKGDFGDADPNYPTRLRDNGARHVETKHEWFGRFTMGHDESVSGEYDAVDPIDIDGTPNLRDDGYDLDRFDDGVLFFPLTYRPGERGKLLFNVCVEQVGDRYDPDDPDKTLYVNAWIDWDTDWTWEEVNQEHIINGLKLAPKDAGSWEPLGFRHPITNTTTVDAIMWTIDGKCAHYEAEFDVGTIGDGELWARFRLDYGEDVGRNDPRPLFRSDDSLRDPDLDDDDEQPAGQGRGYTHGATRFGEVEDYLIGSDFGDAPDPFIGVPGDYPTRKVSNGARHLDMNREWLGWPDIYASVTRETDGWDLTPAEEDRVPNLDFNGLGGNLDGKDDGVVLPFQVQPGQLIFVEIDVSAQIDSRGFANRGPNDEDSNGIPTLKSDCTLGSIPDMEDTPVQHRDRGRYSAWDPKKRLYLNVWADWNANGVWEDNELVISGPLDPEDWGADDKYTLGEPFTDLDNNDVWTANEPYTPTAGIPLRHLTCPVVVPPWVQFNQDFYWRFRLDYGENVATDDEVIHHATEDNRLLDRTYGGALWGEVEDYPMYAYKPVLYEVYSAFALVDWLEFELEDGPPAQFLVTAQETYTGTPIYGLELLFADQDPLWSDVLPLGWPVGWHWDPITGGIDEFAGGIRLSTEDEDCALGPGDSLWFMLAPSFEGQTWPSKIWMHATYIDDVNLGYIVSEGWMIETVDSATQAGLHNSLALDANGYPHISYHDRNLSQLKYARWTGTDWAVETVDSTQGAGLYTSLALDSSGNPHISYYDTSTSDLKYARWDGSQWLIETVDHIGNVGSYSSLALDGSDNPHISYLDDTNGDLKYARWMGDFWLIQTVDYEGIVDYATSLALDDADNAHISYYDLTNGDLKYAWGSGEFWSIETVDIAGDVGKFSSLALDAYGSPHISYFDETNDDLKYARSVVGRGLQSTWWTTETIDSEGTVGMSTSLALDRSGNPHISYHDITNVKVKYAQWTGDAWRFQNVASAGDGDWFASLALDRAGKPHIAFYDDASEVLKYARRADSGFPVVYNFDYALDANGDLATVGEYLNNDVFLYPDDMVRFERSGETRAIVDGGGTLRLERDDWDEDDQMYFVYQQPLPETYALGIKDLWRTHPGTGVYAELTIGYTDDDSPPRLADMGPIHTTRNSKFVVMPDAYAPGQLHVWIYYRTPDNVVYCWVEDHWDTSWSPTQVISSGFTEDVGILLEVIKDHQGYRARITRLDSSEVLLETTPVPPDAMVASDKLDFALFGAQRWWIGESYVAHFDDWIIIPLGDAPCSNGPSVYIMD